MNCQPIPVRDLYAIFAPRDPAASLRASATQFEALGRPFDADFCRCLFDQAARYPSFDDVYRTLASEQAARVERFLGDGK